MPEDYYSILGVPRDASQEDIKRAFRRIARKCHPDVAGADAQKEAKFKKATEAYETLSDSKKRGRYDRRNERTGGSFFEAFYKRSEKEYPKGKKGGRSQYRSSRRRADPANNLDLDDLFNEPGEFGFGGKSAPRRPTSGRMNVGGGSNRAKKPSPVPGSDVHIVLDMPAKMAEEGGTLTAVYYRMQRSDSWRPGSPEPGLVRVQDIADVRLIPGTRDGEVLRERGLGDAGAYGGPYGDLIVQLQLVQQSKSKPKSAPPQAEEDALEVVKLDVSIVEALLGGRVELDTPQGRVRLTVPPGTSSGARLRLKRRGPPGSDGTPSDLYVQVRIVVPRTLDEESRRLIEEFAKLNPHSPRG